MQQSYVRADRGKSQNEAIKAALLAARGGRPAQPCGPEDGWMNMIELHEVSGSFNVHSRCAQVRGMIDAALDVDQRKTEKAEGENRESGNGEKAPPRSWYRICLKTDSTRISRERKKAGLPPQEPAYFADYKEVELPI